MFFFIALKIIFDLSRDGVVQWKTWEVHKDWGIQREENTEQRNKDGITKVHNSATAHKNIRQVKKSEPKLALNS